MQLLNQFIFGIVQNSTLAARGPNYYFSNFDNTNQTSIFPQYLGVSSGDIWPFTFYLDPDQHTVTIVLLSPIWRNRGLGHLLRSVCG